MSDLYKQSIIEAKKLKEIAEIDAKNKIIEAVAPVIKKMIANEAADASRFLFGEEDSPGMEGTDDISAPPSQEEPTLTPGDVPNAAPISPSDGLVGMPMPDDEGKITVDFQQLFSMGGGGAEAAPPVAGGMDSLGAQGAMPNAPTSPEMVPPAASRLTQVLVRLLHRLLLLLSDQKPQLRQKVLRHRKHQQELAQIQKKNSQRQ